jgi:predicted GNAT superfamily acetyltransferase
LAIKIGPDSQPVVDLGYLAALDRKDVIAITLPADIESLRKADLACAKFWRVAVREVLIACFEAGAVVRQMTSNREALLVEWPDRGVK